MNDEPSGATAAFGEAQPHDIMHPILWAELLRFYSVVPIQLLSADDRARWEGRQRIIAQCKEGMFPREAIEWSGERGVPESQIDLVLPEVRQALARAETLKIVVTFDAPFGFNCKTLGREVWVQFRSSFVADLQRSATDLLMRYSKPH